MAKKKIVIIGGGASGLMAALVTAREGGKVTLLERKDRVGKKILATGNGRCNLTNKVLGANRYHSDSRNIFPTIYEQFDLSATLEFFANLGVEVVELDEGKLYPMSLQASSVLNVLRIEAERLGVNVVCDADVTEIQMEPKAIVITKNQKYYADRIILAAGGKSAPDLGSNGSGYTLATALGLNMIQPYPSLVQLESDYSYCKHLKGTKMMASVGVIVDGKVRHEEYGEILFTDYGISGPPILQLSRHASKALHHNIKDVQLTIDLLPNLEKDALDQLLLKRIDGMPYKTMESFFEGMLPKALFVPIIKDNGLDMATKATDISRGVRHQLVDWLKGFTLHITGTRQWNQSQVTAGGIDCTMVDAQSLSSHRYPNLYLCGEILDIDGDCGGFNLQWAWSSGFVAGKKASQ